MRMRAHSHLNGNENTAGESNMRPSSRTKSSDKPNKTSRRVFRFLNISRMREHVRNILGFPWPLTARVPIVAGTLILAVSLAGSRVMMHVVAHEQEAGVRQMAAVYLDGISTTIYPHVANRNLATTTEALHRTMWFHQGMQEQRALVRLPDGSLFADVSGPDATRNGEDPVRSPVLRERLHRGGGFVFDEVSGTAGRRGQSSAMASTWPTSMSHWNSALCSRNG